MKKNKRNKMVGKGSSAGTVLLCVVGFSGVVGRAYSRVIRVCCVVRVGNFI